MIFVMALLGAIFGWVLDALGERLVRVAGYGNRRPRFTGARRLRLRLFFSILLMLGAAWFASQYDSSLSLLPSAVLAFLLLLTIIDLQYRLVLNLLVYPALLLALGVKLLVLQQPAVEVVLGGAFAFGIFYATALVRPGELGAGDVKLAALIGVVLGFPNVLIALLTGAFLGAIVALWLHFMQNRAWGSTIPYAPFLCFGAAAVLVIQLH